MRLTLALPLLAGLFTAGCGAADLNDSTAPAMNDEAASASATCVSQPAPQPPTFAGVNGGACIASSFNCKLRETGGPRVATNDPADENQWGLNTGAPIRDGNGDLLGLSSKTKTTFNYGQQRTFVGEPYVFAVTTSNNSAGWMPLSSIKGHDSFATKVGHVVAHDPGGSKMGCYRVRDAHDPVLELKKVVYDSCAEHERAGDYLPLVRQNGRRSVNLAFDVPGFSLGGTAVDHFPAGQKFQRLDVPTRSGPPSIDIPLYSADGQGRYRRQDGTMKFIYGYFVSTTTGERRIGWVAYDALEVSSNCP